MKDFSARWTGFLTPAESGTYQLGLIGSMNRMWLDGNLIVDDAVLHDPNAQMKTLQLTKGHRYAVKIEFLRGGFGTKFAWLPISADPSFEAAPRPGRPTLWWPWWASRRGLREKR